MIKLFHIKLHKETPIGTGAPRSVGYAPAADRSFPKKKIISAFVTAAFVFALCGCVDISNREFIPEITSEEESVGVGGDLLIIEPQSSEETAPTVISRPDEVTELSFSSNQQDFISSCLFMGDSICSGLGVSGLAENCYAKAGVAARNINEFTFEYGGAQVEPLTVIVNSGIKNLVFIMGINDVNIENTEAFASDYGSFLSRVEALCPDASIYVLSITPVTEDSSFCYNYEIDNFNEALKEAVAGSGSAARHYVDISASLKNADGDLLPKYAAEDGVHLMKEAYYDILYSLCEGAGVA
ncbi:MAG: GDSL-type esterase/lipase family protein [Bacteroides sp.]|nr:GDSL-type esterase/lipase family protein [Bacteroides sp.]